MLFKSKPIIYEEKEDNTPSTSPSVLSTSMDAENSFVAAVLDKSIGEIKQGETKHFYSFGNFNSMRLIFHILKHIGPANILMSSHGISPKTIEGIVRRQDDKQILDFRLILDNRVRTISPKPFDMIVRNFNYRCASIHAKVACIWNDQWKVTLISSQNATDNPKIERGTIYTDPLVFNFDFKTLKDVFDAGTT